MPHFHEPLPPFRHPRNKKCRIWLKTIALKIPKLCTKTYKRAWISTSIDIQDVLNTVPQWSIEPYQSKNVQVTEGTTIKIGFYRAH